MPPTSSRMRLIIGCLFIIIGSSHNTYAQSTSHIGHISFISYGFGICSTQGGSTMADAHSPSGVTHWSSNFQLLKNTHRIKAEIGAHFGMQYMFLGPDGRDFHYTKVWVFPKMMKEPRTGRMYKSLSDELEVSANTKTYSSYILEEPWELVTGKWSLQFYYKGKLIRQEDFILY